SIQRSGFQRHTDFFRNHLTTGQYRNVLQHGFTTVTEARGFYRSHFEGSAQVVHHQRGQRLTFNVFSDDQQRTTRLSHCFQNRDQFLQVVDFLVDQQHQRVVQLDDHFFLVVDEVRRQEAAVELHAFNHFQFVFQAFAFFNGDHAFFAHFFHGFGNDAADGFIGVGRNSTYLSNGLGVGAGFGLSFQGFNHRRSGFVDTALQVHRVHTRRHRLQAFVHNGLRQYGGGGGAVTGLIVGLGRHFFHHLRAHVLELVFQFNFARYGYTVFGDGRGAERFFQHHVTAFRAQGHFNGVRQYVYTRQHFYAGVIAKFYFFSSHFGFLKFGFNEIRLIAELRFDDAVDFAFIQDQQVFTIDFDGVGAGIFTEHHGVAYFDRHGNNAAIVGNTASTDGNHFTLIRFFSSRT